MTERLYFADSRLLTFDAAVVATESVDGRTSVELDRTAFYPTGGGQPNDEGTIAGHRVVDVIEDPGERILHILADAVAIDVGATVHAEVDAARRRDHMQQHTGQHILSAAFELLFDAETKGFRMGFATSEIDVEIDDAADDRIARAEDLANDIVFRDLEIRAHVVDAAAAAELPLRKQSDREGTIRIIEIDGFDWNPCGGTHAIRTGEVGLIAVRGFERAKRMARIEFVCGARALSDYRSANRLAIETSRVFSTGRDEGPEQVRRLFDEAKQLRKRVRELWEIASEVEGAQLFSGGARRTGYRIVARRLDGRSAEELRMLAHKILACGDAVALLASDDGGTARLVFARSPAPALESVDCGALLRVACETLGGRGGGRPDMAQGGGPNATEIDAALAKASSQL